MAWFGPAHNMDHPGDRPPRWAPIGRAGRLVPVIIGIVIALLVVATQTVSAVDGSNIADDQPSPDTPPWFGGRVEMSEHGFAVTFPDGWVVFDLADDADAQLQQALRVHQGESVLADVFRAYLLSVESSGGDLFAIDSRTFDWCLIAVLPDVGTELDHLAERAFASLSDRHTDVDGPEVVNLPVGPARRIVFGDMVESAASYFVEASGEQFTVMCGGLRSTGDNWLSIPETFELLLPASSTGPVVIGGRIEIPQAGFAIEVPHAWMGADLSHPDLVQQLESTGETGSWLVDALDGHLGASFDDRVALGHEMALWTSPAGEGPESRQHCEAYVLKTVLTSIGQFVELYSSHSKDDPSQTWEQLDLPAGQAARNDYLWSPTSFGSDYTFFDGRRFVTLSCVQGIPVEGVDEAARRRAWLSIAETFEFLSEEE